MSIPIASSVDHHCRRSSASVFIVPFIGPAPMLSRFSSWPFLLHGHVGCRDALRPHLLQVGNLQPLFKAEYPKCWGTHEECSTRLLSSIHYTQVRVSVAALVLPICCAYLHTAEAAVSLPCAACLLPFEAAKLCSHCHV